MNLGIRIHLLSFESSAVYVFNGVPNEVTVTTTETVETTHTNIENITVTTKASGLFSLIGISIMVLISSAVAIPAKRRYT